MDEEKIISILASILRDLWIEERIKEGYHLPEKCPVYEKSGDNEDILKTSDLIHCRKCDPNLRDLGEIDNFTKEEYLKRAEIFYEKMLKEGIKFY